VNYDEVRARMKALRNPKKIFDFAGERAATGATDEKDILLGIKEQENALLEKYAEVVVNIEEKKHYLENLRSRSHQANDYIKECRVRVSLWIL
jgi:hypothetical protein